MLGALNVPNFVVVLAAAAVLLGAGTAEAARPDKAREKSSPVVAVFPFKVLNGEAEYGHLGEGASEAIINRIVNDKSLRVVEESQIDKAVNSLARNQTGLFEEESYLNVGKMVDARFVVVGSVQVVAGQVVVTARLLEVETRQLLASARSKQTISGVFEAYDDVAGQLLTKVTFHLSQRVATGDSADDVAVRLLVEEGKMHDPLFPAASDAAGQPLPKDLQRALASYNKAVLRDPRSAVALLALGDAEFRMSKGLETGDPGRSRSLILQAREHLRTSVTLDAQNKWAWNLVGRVEGQLQNHAEARAAFERALGLDAGFATARYGLAVALFNLGDYEAARENAQRAKDGGEARAPQLLNAVTTAIAAQQATQNPAR